MANTPFDKFKKRQSEFISSLFPAIFPGLSKKLKLSPDVDGVVFVDDGGDEAAVARAALAAVGRALDAPPPAAAIERNYARAQDFLDLEGRLVSVIDAALDARSS